MKNLKLILYYAFLALLISSCTNVIDKTINKEDYPIVKEFITNDEALKEMKKKFILDNLSTSLQTDDLELITFSEKINSLKTEYDSIEKIVLTNRENNKKLREFISIVDASSISISEYKGYLSMKLKFNNQFDKEVLYAGIKYKYVNKYDSEFFEESVKITDEVAKDFKGEIEVSTKEEYNDVAEFLYKEVPIQAPLKLRKELGEKKANDKVHHEFLMKGLQIETLGVVFKDKSEIFITHEEWEYLEI